MISEIFESKPRWKGAPRICIAENLLAFNSKEEALEFHERNGPGNKIIRMGKCAACGCWHYIVKIRPPSGDSSGSSRR